MGKGSRGFGGVENRALPVEIRGSSEGCSRSVSRGPEGVDFGLGRGATSRAGGCRKLGLLGCLPCSPGDCRLGSEGQVRQHRELGSELKMKCG